MKELLAAMQRKEDAKREIRAADAELGELFAQLIENDWDLKAAAGELGISRQTAYDLVNRLDS